MPSHSAAGTFSRVAPWPLRRPQTQASSSGLRAAQRLHLARLAAQVALELAVAEEIDAVARHHLLDFPGVREVHGDLEAVPLAGAVDEVVGLGVEAAGVEREDRDVEPRLGDHVRERLVLDAESTSRGLRGRGSGRPRRRGSPRRSCLRVGPGCRPPAHQWSSGLPCVSPATAECNQLTVEITITHDKPVRTRVQVRALWVRARRCGGGGRRGPDASSGAPAEADQLRAGEGSTTPSVSSRRSLRHRPPP